MADMSAWTSPGMDRNPHTYGYHEAYAAPLAHPGPYVVQGGHLPTGDLDTKNFGNLNVPRSPSKPATKAKESVHRFVGLGVGLASVAAEHVLSHPCIVLRRQCQVIKLHYNTLTNYQIVEEGTLIEQWMEYCVANFQVSVTTLWKGIGSTLMVKGIAIATETGLAEVTPLPKEVNRHSSIKKLVQHILLKGLTLVVVTPFYAASLVETVQSEIASERPGVFDFLREGVQRLMSLSTPQMTRLLPVWKLFTPLVVYGILHYVVASLAQYTVLVSVKSELMERKKKDDDSSLERSLYETYYPELIATFTGNLLADTLLFPLETIIHRLCLQGTRTIIDNTDYGLGVIPIITRYEGFADCFQNVISEEGFAGLYKGFGALLLQYGLHMAILKLTKFLFVVLSSEEFLSPEASPSKRMIPIEEIQFGSPRHRPDGLPR
ncbi:hypothetical protein LSH36_1186g00003 [Paralvinella palmiformis]|uniref:Solute carrier family 25 member 46 n=1 Tax=Paralvinella palmiformis TaxID=53620 RepID=A0AAD9IU34_9ANNE|nr:hypothetical protein LSH36_1186g00003 [Paralvinella palmiformis]